MLVGELGALGAEDGGSGDEPGNALGLRNDWGEARVSSRTRETGKWPAPVTLHQPSRKYARRASAIASWFSSDQSRSAFSGWISVRPTGVSS